MGRDDGWTSKNLQSSVLFFVDLISSGDELLVFCFGHDRAAMCFMDLAASIGLNPYPNITANTLVHVIKASELLVPRIKAYQRLREV